MLVKGSLIAMKYHIIGLHVMCTQGYVLNLEWTHTLGIFKVIPDMIRLLIGSLVNY